MIYRVPFILLSAIYFAASFARADVFDLPEPEPVMNKKYTSQSDITFSVGYLPVGAFNKHVDANLSYIHLFNENHGWEVINAAYLYELRKSLKKVLMQYYGATDNDIRVLKYLVSSNYVFAPFYTKSLLFNSKIVYSSLSFVTGPALGFFNNGILPGADLGLIQKFYLDEKYSLKFDARYFYFFANSGVMTNHIVLNVGLSYNFGGLK